jgi:hypothetical protein
MKKTCYKRMQDVVNGVTDYDDVEPTALRAAEIADRVVEQRCRLVEERRAVREKMDFWVFPLVPTWSAIMPVLLKQWLCYATGGIDDQAFEDTRRLLLLCGRVADGRVKSADRLQ